MHIGSWRHKSANNCISIQYTIVDSRHVVYVYYSLQCWASSAVKLLMDEERLVASRNMLKAVLTDIPAMETY